MPAKQAWAGKPCLFILVIFSVLALSENNIAKPFESPEPTAVKDETAFLVLLPSKEKANAADQAPNEVIGKAHILLDKEQSDVMSAKKLKVNVNGKLEEAESYIVYADSNTVYFMRAFNRLWETYWVAAWAKEGNFTLSDAQNMKVLMVEYEELRKSLRLFANENTAKSFGFQADFKFFGDLAIRHRIQAIRYVLEIWESEAGITTFYEMKKSIRHINKMIVLSNKEVEKINTLYANYVEAKRELSARKRKDWADDWSNKYTYNVDR
ncbi:hypothetical protein B0H99_102186 [Planomicrobium soli]|uniref:Uncharacterized protein n=1 Tax=Planomicrobium soli TaxID=1176648 RepID=A0A2P8H5J9_9BACL|nr:hypothetical protein [Planomicrobium soli]PSL41502.1 hypothetical protein B0H99_102186 [Planomicrobium soli]